MRNTARRNPAAGAEAPAASVNPPLEAAPPPDPGRALVNPEPAASALDAHGYDPADFDWVPVLRKPRHDGWTPQRRRAFIGALADCGLVETAARKVGMSRESAYRLRRSPGGQAFAAAWDAAIQQAAHALIDAAFERAINGSDEPVFDREGRRVGRRFRQSDGLMMFLLRKHFPQRYGDINRDRPADAASPPAPPVAETMVALEPVRPDDPAALLAPETLDGALELATICDGKLPHWQRQDGVAEAATDPSLPVMGQAFEDELEAAKRAADPAGYARAEAMREAGDDDR